MRRFRICKYNGGGKSRRPILICEGQESKIQVFLAWNYQEGVERSKKVYLKGYLQERGANEDKEINFKESHLGSNVWNLIVTRSGKTRLMAGGDWGQEDIYCKSVFKVTKFTYGDGNGINDSWENPITKVQLTLNNCNEVKQTEICDIEIESSVGLTWNPPFKPKVFFK